MTLYNDILDDLHDRKLHFVVKIFPLYLCSYASHCFNLANQIHHIYSKHGQPVDTRVHIIMVAPPGWTKSFTLRTLIGDDNAVFADTGVDFGFEASMTGAGFIGSFSQSKDGVREEIPGAAQELAQGIMGIEEFSEITNMMQAQHSAELEGALLTVLDSGYARKRRAFGKISYQSFVSLWAGTQPTRLSLGSGFARRFAFIQIVPTPADRTVMKQLQIDGRYVVEPMKALTDLHDRIRLMRSDIDRIRHVDFDSALDQWFQDTDIEHYECRLYEALALGYALMTQSWDSRLYVSLTDELRSLLERQLEEKQAQLFGAEETAVVRTITSMGGKVEEMELMQVLARVQGIPSGRARELLSSLRRHRHIRIQGGVVWIGKT